MKAWISGRAGSAVLDDGESLLFVDSGDAVPCSPRRLDILMASAAPLVVLVDTTPADVRDALDREVRLDRAKLYFLSLLDDTLDMALRREVAAALELLLVETSSLDRMLRNYLAGAPLPSDGDLVGAREASTAAAETGALLAWLETAQPHIAVACMAWDRLALDGFNSFAAAEYARQWFAQNGGFAELARALSRSSLPLLLKWLEVRKDSAPPDWGPDPVAKLTALAHHAGLRAASPETSDEDLMERYRVYRDRDRSAFEVLFRRHRRPLYRLCLRLVADQALAEDLLQETFLRVIKDAEGYRRQAKFRTWLYTIARNLCIEARRDAEHRARFQARGAASVVDATLLDLVAQPVDVSEAADEMSRPLHERIEGAIDRLEEELREVFVLREVPDLTFEEIAAIVGSPENTVKTRMRHALERLRELTAGETDDLGYIQRACL